MKSILSKIAASKRLHIARQKEQISEQALLNSCQQIDPALDFTAALESKIRQRKSAIIA